MTNKELQMRAWIPAVAICAVAMAIGGCGGSRGGSAAKVPGAQATGDQRAILDTIDRLQSASRQGDGATICRLVFTANLVRSVEAAANRSCASEVRRNVFSPNEEISVGRDIRIRGSAATAVIQEQNGRTSTLSLLKQAGEWRIDRLTPRKAQ